MGYIVVALKVHPEGSKYASECEELGVASFGDTEEEALRNIREAVLVHLNGLERIGERDRYFRERGIEMVIGGPLRRARKVSLRPAETVSLFEVPISSAA